MSRPHPYYDRWEPEPPDEPEPWRRWLLIGLGTIVGACLVVACAAGAYFLLRPVLQQPTSPAPPAIPTLPGSSQTATAVAANGEGDVTLPEATQEQQPAPTVTLPTAQDGAVATYASAAPVVDGDLDDWPDGPTIRSAYRVYAFDGWDGSSDMDATWRLSWDEARLYVAVHVVDDTHVQTQEGLFIYQGDSLELQIDINPEAGATRVNPATTQIILSPGDFGAIPSSAARFRGTEAGALEHTPGHSIDVAARQAPDGYVLEAAIPWANLNLTPSAGMRLGVALNANDNDTPGAARQEVMQSSAEGRTLTNPATWGALILQAP